jgi:hypothetical protein
LVGSRGAVALATGVAAVVVAAALVGTASAHKPRFRSTITIHDSFDQVTFEEVFFGRVDSPKRKCRRHRTVLLYNENVQGPLSSDLTNRRGHWEVRLASDNIGGDYYARVLRKVKRDYVCKGARSESIPPPN